MRVKDIMSMKLVTVELDDTLATVKEIFERLKFHHLLVVESHKLVGVVSDRDLFKALSPNIGTLSETLKDAATLNKRVHQIMSRKPVVLMPDATIEAAIAHFNTHPITCIPIVDADFIPLGIVSWRDIFRELGKRKEVFPEELIVGE